MELAKITSKGQITIPSAIRKMLGVKDGDKVLFVQEGEDVYKRQVMLRWTGRIHNWGLILLQLSVFFPRQGQVFSLLGISTVFLTGPLCPFGHGR